MDIGRLRRRWSGQRFGGGWEKIDRGLKSLDVDRSGVTRYESSQLRYGTVCVK